MISAKAYVKEIYSLEFICSSSYDNPYTDVSIYVTFESANGKKIKIPGFWYQENVWMIRFAPPKEGAWQWTSYASNTQDSGLHGLTGRLEVVSSSRKDAIRKHGFIKVSENKRGFVHEDGNPFFWLGDTVWAAPMKSTYEEWTKYLSYRVGQGFNVFQVNSLYQHDADSSIRCAPFSNTNDGWDLTRPSSEYFKYIDEMMYTANHYGVYIALVVLWCNFVPGANPGWKDMVRPAGFTPSLAARYGKYLAARYAAFGTIWIVSGDTDYEDSYVESVYDAAAEAIKNSSPYATLMSAHLSARFFTPPVLNEKDWLDFHMFQSGHHNSTQERAVYYSQKNREHSPPRPVINSEPCYENICFFSLPERVERSLVRKVAWYSLLSGANAGITYGAHGLWQWHHRTDGFREEHKWGMPLDWNDALSLKGADDYAFLKEFFKDMNWWELEPADNIFLADDDCSMLIAADKNLNDIVVYLSCASDLHYMEGNKDVTLYDIVWFNPEDYTTYKADEIINSDGVVLIRRAPWDGDAVLHMKLVLSGIGNKIK